MLDASIAMITDLVEEIKQKQKPADACALLLDKEIATKKQLEESQAPRAQLCQSS